MKIAYNDVSVANVCFSFVGDFVPYVDVTIQLQIQLSVTEVRHLARILHIA